MSRRLAALVSLLPLALAVASADASPRPWAAPQIAAVTSARLFDATPATFDPEAPLTAGALATAVARLQGVVPPQPADAAAPVSIAELDASLVHALGLDDAAADFDGAAAAAGLQPPAQFGTEAVARLLGLRVDHPVGQDSLELEPQDTATRAEAAYSLARILRLRPPARGIAAAGTRFVPGAAAAAFAPDPTAGVAASATSFALPALTDWQRRLLSTAVSYIGYPYVWGGTLDRSVGFDCSGFVWQVYKLTPYPAEGALAGVLRGRTAMAMGSEVKNVERIPLAALQPADVLFFGRGPHSKKAQIDHTGIYLGNGWFIHASGSGVALARLDGWYAATFAWARRPLAEAALA